MIIKKIFLFVIVIVINVCRSLLLIYSILSRKSFNIRVLLYIPLDQSHNFQVLLYVTFFQVPSVLPLQAVNICLGHWTMTSSQPSAPCTAIQAPGTLPRAAAEGRGRSLLAGRRS
jgi:hypothetical protein